MRKCNACKAILREDSSACDDCKHLLEKRYLDPIQRAVECTAQHRQIRPHAMQPGSHSARGVVTVSLLISAVVITLVILVNQNLEAQTSAFPQGQLTQQVAQRQAELLQAIDALEALHFDVSHSVKALGENALAREAWGRDFRGRLNNIKQSFRIYGEAGQFYSNATAEDGVRNATLYLSSLERSMASRDGRERVSQHEAALVKSLKVARASLY